jgi:hypothetical protein
MISSFIKKPPELRAFSDHFGEEWRNVNDKKEFIGMSIGLTHDPAAMCIFPDTERQLETYYHLLGPLKQCGKSEKMSEQLLPPLEVDLQSFRQSMTGGR